MKFDYNKIGIVILPQDIYDADNRQQKMILSYKDYENKIEISIDCFVDCDKISNMIIWGHRISERVEFCALLRKVRDAYKMKKIKIDIPACKHRKKLVTLEDDKVVRFKMQNLCDK